MDATYNLNAERGREREMVIANSLQTRRRGAEERLDWIECGEECECARESVGIVLLQQQR